MQTDFRETRKRVIAVINGKGGVLKTTLTANVGGELAASGQKVLLVDLDPQGNLAEDLGYTSETGDDQGRSLASAIAFGGDAKPIENVRDEDPLGSNAVNAAISNMHVSGVFVTFCGRVSNASIADIRSVPPRPYMRFPMVRNNAGITAIACITGYRVECCQYRQTRQCCRRRAMQTDFRETRKRVIAVINGKGGVLKTTLTANVGGELAASGQKVLLVDLDPQGNLAEDLGYTSETGDDQGRSLASAIAFGGDAKPIENVRANLDVLPGGVHLEQATAALTAMASKDPDGAKLALARVLAPMAATYDMVLIDCPPGDETLQTAALAAAKWAFVPVKSDASSRKGMAAVAHRIDAVAAINPDLDLLGVVLVAVGTSAKTVLKQARSAIAEAFGNDDVVFTATVRHSEATAQATRERGMLAAELDAVVRSGPKWYDVIKGNAEPQALAPKSSKSVADDLFAVAQEVVTRVATAEREEARV